MSNNNYYFKSLQQPLNAKIVLDGGQEQISTDLGNQIRKPYSKPQLEELGDLRALTFGSFPGIGDSTGEGKFTPP